MTRLRVAILVATFLFVGCDHASKHLAKGNLEHSGGKALIGNVLDLTYSENRDSGLNLFGASRTISGAYYAESSPKVMQFLGEHLRH